MKPDAQRSVLEPKRMADTLIFLPIWNQAKELPQVINEIRLLDPVGIDFLLVNNGSTDRSPALADASGLPVVNIPVNLGIGNSFRIAYEWARNRNYEFFGSMAANGKMLANETIRLVAPLRAGVADYVTGSRFLPGGGYPNLPRFRRLAIPMVNVIARMMTGIRLSDATNGFRVFRIGILEAATFDLGAPWLRTYGLEYYVYAKALLDPRLKCIEVPSTMRYPGEGRYTKIRPGLDWMAMVNPWVRARFDRHGFGKFPWEQEPFIPDDGWAR